MKDKITAEQVLRYCRDGVGGFWCEHENLTLKERSDLNYCKRCAAVLIDYILLKKNDTDDI